jgi:hypothetical protein
MNGGRKENCAIEGMARECDVGGENAENGGVSELRKVLWQCQETAVAVDHLGEIVGEFR